MARNTYTRPEALRRFIIALSVVIVVYTVAVFSVIYVRTERLTLASARAEAASDADLILSVRDWNAGYGGVYVATPQQPGTNKLLARLGVPTEYHTTSGTVLTLRDPAVMTSEISRITRTKQGVSYRLISDQPLSPLNVPVGRFERDALASFQKGGGPVDTVNAVGGSRVLRYATPLNVDPSCLRCHAQQGYRVGDVRGAVVVTIPLKTIDQELRFNLTTLIVLAVVTTGMLMLATWFLLSRLVGQLAAAESQLRMLAVTDELTGLANRRAGMEALDREFERARRGGSQLGLIFLDLDHFKRVNDEHGHAFGDTVLRETADRMRSVLRSYDVVARTGGEEFLVIAPDTDLAEAEMLADRIRAAIAASPIAEGDDSIAMTLSAGVTTERPDDADPAATLRRADEALYAAKESGRDRTIIK